MTKNTMTKRKFRLYSTVIILTGIIMVAIVMGIIDITIFLTFKYV